MKAIIVQEPNIVEMIEVEQSKVRPQDVLVKVFYAGICGTDIDIVKGEIDLVKDGRIQYPVRIGHEWSGIVAEVGSEVNGIAVGDRVVSETFVSCTAIGTIDNPWPGAFSDYMCIPWYNVYKVSD